MSDQPVHDLTMIGECSHRPHFVLTHEARVTRHVGAKMAASFRSIGSGGEAISSGDQGRAVGSKRLYGCAAEMAEKLGGITAHMV